MPRAGDIQPPPPLDFRGLPTEDVYGNKIAYPDVDSFGTPTLKNPSASPAINSGTSPTQTPATERAAAASGTNMSQEFARQNREVPRSPRSAPKLTSELPGFGSPLAPMVPESGFGATQLPYNPNAPRTSSFADDGTELAPAQPMVDRRDANGNSMSLGVDGQWHTTTSKAAAEQLQTGTSPGAMRGSGTNLVGTELGVKLRGTQGALMDYVEDPMNPEGGALPVPPEFMDQRIYMANITPEQRSAIKTMLIEQGGDLGKRLQAIETAKGDVGGADSKWRGHKGASQATKTLQDEEDALIFGAMRDPSGIMRQRGQQAREQERSTAAEQKASQVAQERAAALEQRRMAQLWSAAQKQAQDELGNNPYKPPSQQDINRRTSELFLANGGRMPGQQRGPAPAQSGAPDSRGMPVPPRSAQPPAAPAPQPVDQGPIAISPDSPVDFQALPNAPGKFVAIIPSMVEGGREEVLPAMNLNGRAVVVVDSPAREDALPPGTMFVRAGDIARNKQDVQVKQGEQGKASTLAGVAPEEEARLLEESGGKFAKGSERAKATEKFREDQATFNRLNQEATRIAAEATADLGVSLDPSGKPVFSDAAGDLVNTATGARDVRGEFEAQKQKALAELAATTFTDPEKMPSWVKVNPATGQISSVENPSMPAGLGTPKERQAAKQRLLTEGGALGDEMRALEMERSKLTATGDVQRGRKKDVDTVKALRELEAKENDLLLRASEMPTAEERARAESEYFGKQGTTREQVAAERALTEANSVYRAHEMRNGRKAIRVNGQSIPAVRVTAGKMSGNMPRAETVEQAMLLLRMGTPFATYRQGVAIPTSGLRDDPRIKTALSQANKRIPASMGAATKNPGFVALGKFVIEKFGYLGEEKAKTITFALAKQLGYELTGDIE